MVGQDDADTSSHTTGRMSSSKRGMVGQDDADTSSHTTGRMSSSKARVQIIGRVSGRCNWTVEQKLAIIGEAFASGSSVASTIERHEISSGQLYTWRRQLLDGELGGVRNGNLDQQDGLGFARVELAPPGKTPTLPPALTASSSPSSTGACERSDDRRGMIEIELRSGVRVRVHEGVDGGLLTSVRRSMIALPAHGRIYLACGSTDMRRGFDGLAVMVQEVLMQDPHSGALFAFKGKRGDLIKLLWWDGQGLCLFAKRLEKGRFIWPMAATGTVSLSAAQLAMLLEGIDWRAPVRSWRPELAG